MRLAASNLLGAILMTQCVFRVNSPTECADALLPSFIVFDLDGGNDLETLSDRRAPPPFVNEAKFPKKCVCAASHRLHICLPSIQCDSVLYEMVGIPILPF